MKQILLSGLFIFSLVFIVACQSDQTRQSDWVNYTCPMHPQIRSDNPGQCPICGMNLVPVKTEKPQDHVEHQTHQDKNSSPPEIQINPRYVQNIGMLTEKVQHRELTQVITTYGKIAHDHRLWVAQNEYIQALKLGDKNLIKATERKLIFLGLSEKWIETIKKTKSADLTLHLKTDQNKPKYIEAYAYQEDSIRIKEGLKVEITDQKGRFLAHGSVKAIGTLVDLNSRSIRVLIESENPLNLKLNTFVQVKIKIPLGKKLSIPTQAILFNGDHNLVYISKGEGSFEPRMIQIGEEAGLYHEILGGLNEGDLVVTNGHFLIDSESQIKFGNSQSEHHH